MTMTSQRITNNEVGVSKHLPITHLNSSTVFELSNGQVGSTLKVRGVSFDTASNDELNDYRRLLHHAICVLGDEFAIYKQTLRRKMSIALDGEFDNDFIKTVDSKYHRQFKHKQLFVNELYVTIVYKGIDSGKFGKGLNFFNRLSRQTVKTARQEYRHLAMGRLKKAVQQWRSTLSAFKPIVLGERDEALGYSELLSFHGLLVNALQETQFNHPSYAPPLVKRMSKVAKAYGKYPEGNIATYLPAHRLFFGEYIEFYKTPQQSLYGAMLSIKTYASETASIMLDRLLHLDGEFIYTNSFSIESDDVAQSTVVKQLIRKDNANDPAVSEMEELVQCRDDLASGRLRLGYHHNTLMILSDNTDTLQALVNKAMKIYNDAGFTTVQETIGMEPAFWAQLPGNQQYIVRSSLITSQNFVDFAPLHNYRTGYRDKNHLGQAVTLIETPSRTPLFFNYHSRGSGSKNDLTPGHTTIIGGNGSGKTVFMGFMDAQMSRYGGRSFFFDRDRGMEIYIRAAGGVYSIISPDHPNDVQFNPFALPDTADNRLFLKQWLVQLVKTDTEADIPQSISSELGRCVDYAYDSLSKEHRNLHNATKLLSLAFPRWDALRTWLRGDHTRHDGEYAYLFDHSTDQLDLSAAKIGFDMTDLMNQPKRVLTAVCMYLMHRLKQSLNGQRLSLYFDEGWQILDNEYWRRQLKSDLPTLRKKNAHVILATQSPQSVVSSAISAQFLDNCATNIFFCNARANYERDYRHFSITPSEFDFIKDTPRELRLFLYKQSEDSQIGRLNLSGMDDELAVFSANARTITLLDRLRQHHGDAVEDWYPAFIKQYKTEGDE